MDGIKEIFEAFSQRIKSPIFGYVIIAFLAANWKPVFFLLFSGEPTPVKFTYLDENTSWATLFWLPLIIGVLAALAAPWISLAGAIWAESPTNKKRIRAVKAANEVSKLRNELRDEQNKEVGSLIESARQDAEVQKIEDEKSRMQLQEQIDEIRQQANSINEESAIEQFEGLPLERKVELLQKQVMIAHEKNNYDEEKDLRHRIQQLLKYV